MEIKIHKEQVMKKMKDLDGNNVNGSDNVSGYILKQCRELTDPVYDILKCSIGMGEMLNEWKRADVILTYKGGSKTEPLNYRSVALTSMMWKLWKVIIYIYKKRINHLEKKIIKEQIGFREKGLSQIYRVFTPECLR